MSKTNVQIGDLIGGWGKFQWNVFLFDILVQLTTMAHVMTIAFMAPKVDFTCQDHEHEASDGPFIEPGAGFQSCSFNGIHGNESSRPCSGYNFDTSSSPFGVTLSAEYSLVCERTFLASLSQALYVLGYFIASLAAGYASDRFGRKPVLWIAVVGELITGASCTLTFAMWHFMLSRFFLGIFVYAKFLTAYTMVMEVAGTEERTVYGPMTRIGRSFGIIIITIVAYYTRNFRYLQLVVTLPGIVKIFWLLTIPESPRWLLIKGRIDEALIVVSNAAKMNGITNNDEVEIKDQLHKIYDSYSITSKTGNNRSFSDLFRTPVLRKNSIVMCFNWFITVFIYYALSLNVQDLGGNLFVNFFMSGLVEIPSIILCIYALKKCGRRQILANSLIALSLSSLIGIPFYFLSFNGAVAIRVSFAMIGKFAATIAFTVSYLYSSEIYPTEIRQLGLGLNSASSRLGSMLSPFIKELNEHTHVSVTMTIFGAAALANAFACMLLPETAGKEIPDTIDQIESKPLIHKNDFENSNNNNLTKTSNISKEITEYADERKSSSANDTVYNTNFTL